MEAGLGTAALTTVDQLLDHETRIFQDRVRLGVQTKTPGIDFTDAWRNRQTVTYQDQEFHILSKADLTASKRAAGREIDLDDVRILEIDDERGAHHDE